MKTVTTFLLALVFFLVVPTSAAAQRGGGGHSRGAGIGMNSRNMGSGHEIGGWQNRNSGGSRSMNCSQSGTCNHDQSRNRDRDRQHDMDHYGHHSGYGHDGSHHNGTEQGHHGNDWRSQSWCPSRSDISHGDTQERGAVHITDPAPSSGQARFGGRETSADHV